MAQSGSASRSQREGQGFESPQVHNVSAGQRLRTGNSVGPFSCLLGPGSQLGPQLSPHLVCNVEGQGSEFPQVHRRAVRLGRTVDEIRSGHCDRAGSSRFWCLSDACSGWWQATYRGCGALWCAFYCVDMAGRPRSPPLTGAATGATGPVSWARHVRCPGAAWSAAAACRSSLRKFVAARMPDGPPRAVRAWSGS